MIPVQHIFQRNFTECGPCCLSIVHALRGKPKSVDEILVSLGFKPDAKVFYTSIGQLANYLSNVGFSVRVILGNSRIISPGWIRLPTADIIARVTAWAKAHPDDYWAMESTSLIPYIEGGGKFEMLDIDSRFILERLKSGSILIPCLDEAWLWGERFYKGKVDDINGKTDGHFVVLTNARQEEVEVLDPYPTNIPSLHGHYFVRAEKIATATLSWDGMMIEIFPN